MSTSQLKGTIHNTKLIKAIQRLSSEELSQLRDFACSPYFNKHEKVRQLSELITDEYFLKSVQNWTKQDLAKRLFPDESANEQRISDVMTYTYRLLDTFLQQQSFEQNGQTQEYHRLRSFRQYDFPNEVRKILSQSPIRQSDAAKTPEDFLHSYRLEGEADHFHLAQDSRTKDKSIERKTLALDLFFLAEKLYNACEMLNRQNIINVTYQIDMLEEVQGYIESHFEELVRHPYIAIYYHVLQTLLYPEKEEHYQQLVGLLEQHNTNFQKEDLRRMYDYAENYCIKKINQGKNTYLSEIFQLYQQLLDSEAILENGQLAEGDFKNIVTVGTRLQEFEWTEQFIHNYRPCLPENARENAFTYNLASLYYAQGRYDDALPLLQTVAFKEVVYNLGARSMLLKIYYDQEEDDPLFSLIDSFNSYLRRDQTLSGYQSRAHKNLLKLVKRLANLRIRQVASRKETMRKELTALKKRIQTTEEIVNLKWLEEKVGELERAVTNQFKKKA